MPVQRAAAQFGISDVALAKHCRRQQIPLPPRGYLAKKAAGQEMPRKPLPDIEPSPPSNLEDRSEVGPQHTMRPCAIYLVGHGPRRQPRLIDLQMVRIERYRHALQQVLHETFQPVETFV